MEHIGSVLLMIAVKTWISTWIQSATDQILLPEEKKNKERNDVKQKGTKWI